MSSVREAEDPAGEPEGEEQEYQTAGALLEGMKWKCRENRDGRKGVVV